MAEKVGQIFYEVAYDTRPLIDGQRAAQREVDKAVGSFNAITEAIKIYAATALALKSIRLADDFKLLQTRVEVAADSIQAGTAAFYDLLAISKRTQTAVDASVSTFTRLNQSLLQMGGTQDDTLRLTELLAKAIKVSGASAVEAKSAMLQFGQALGSGKLAGDELRSLLENAPYLMRQLADGLGVPIGALKKLGEEGKLTSDVVVNALSKAADRINSDFAKFPLTIDAAMTAAIDAFIRANAQLDTLSGASAAATGIVKGTGQAFDDLAGVLSKVNDESEKLSRADLIAKWADGARTALSYVVDAGDGVARVFQIIGVSIGTQVAKTQNLWQQLKDSFAKGETMPELIKRLTAPNDASMAASAQIRAILDKPLMGQQMRDAAAADAASRRTEDRGFTPNLPGSKLRTPGGAGDKAKKLPPDYLNDGLDKLEEQLRERYDRIADSEIEAAEKAREKVRQNQQQAQEMLIGQDPIARLQAELETKTALLLQYAEQDQANAELYAAARLALEQQTQAQMGEIVARQRAQQQAANSAMLQNYSGLFGSLSDLAKAFGGEQSKTYRALFAVSKAFAIADAIVKIQQGIAAAAALPFPANIPAMASVAAATAGIVSTIQGVQFSGGREYGGPTSAGNLYRVNEGGRPEMFTAAGGRQFMLPTANGRVTPADQVGGSTVVQVIVQNTGTPQRVVSQSLDSEGVLRLVQADLVDQFASNTGPVFNALRGSTNVQGRLS